MSSSHRVDYVGAAYGDVLQPADITATIDIFTVANPNLLTSTIVAEYPITNTGVISIGRPFMQGLTDNTYLIAVRSVDSAGNVSRYILYRPADFTILWPTYAGQALQPSAVVEIWANPAEDTALSSEAIVFTINTLSLYTRNSASLAFCSTLANTELTLIAS